MLQYLLVNDTVSDLLSQRSAISTAPTANLREIQMVGETLRALVLFPFFQYASHPIHRTYLFAISGALRFA